MSAFQPRVIRRTDPSRIEIDWVDGRTSSYPASHLRRICPCAQCVNELTGQRMLDPATIPDELTQSDTRLVGNYALAMRFSDGHETGIYPFRYLRDHDPAL